MRSIRSFGDEERGRVLELNRRLVPVERAAFGLLLGAAAMAVPDFGWAPLVSTVLAGVVVSFGHLRAKYYRRAELVLVASWLIAELAFAAGIALADGQQIALLSVLAFPTMAIAVTFPGAWAARAGFFMGILMVGLGLGLDASYLAHRGPQALTYPLVAAIGAAIVGSRIRDLDAESRSTAVVDRLTGMLNRAALTPRIAELAYQASVTDQQISVVVGDIDHFKLVNDEHGHAVGDSVLRGVAERMRTALGAFESIYRVGGEEFVVLLAGTDVHAAASLAERLRRAVEGEAVGGLSITMSFGVAASPGGEFDFEKVFAEADGALYEAKRGGRNRVRLIAGPDAAALALRIPDSRDRRVASSEGIAAHIAVADNGGRSRVDAPRERGLQRARRHGSSWLVRDDVERDHLLDLAHRVRGTHMIIYPLVFGAVFAATPWFGVLNVIPPITAFFVVRAVGKRILRFRHPDMAVLGAWIISQTGSLGGFLLINGHQLPSLTAIMVLSVISVSAQYPPRGVAFAVVYSAIAITIAALSLNTHRVLSMPATLAYPLALLGCVTLLGRAVGASAVYHRGAAVVDQLTGMLNRVALEARTAELAHQANATGEQVALILADLDHFKSVNDEHGHGVGDAVLRDVAYRFRSDLRAFESAYRIGGEEFVVLLAGADALGAANIAERLRVAVQETPAAGITVSMSFGVAASESGSSFDYTEVFARADAALYEAKLGGRDCVRVDNSLPAPAPAEAAPLAA